MQLHGLASFASGKERGGQGQGLAGREGEAWTDCFDKFYAKIISHMTTLEQVGQHPLLFGVMLFGG